jgi:acyl carrier protein
VLDGHLEILPAGVVGEICIGGIGPARGYFKRPGLTAERFVPNPFGNGDRLYRTGDLARWRADGQLEFVGRIDHQVKIRGFRIELGEIEAALRSHASIRDALVVGREDTPGDKRLIAYIVPVSEQTVDVVGLRAHLSQTLPDYMVPAAFVSLPAFPLTPNGKVNRRALPAPEGAAVARHEYVAPRNSTEEVLVGIWREVLKLDKVGVHDNFFELGGDSLIATRVLVRIRAAWTVELPLHVLFDAQSVAELADRVEIFRTASNAVSPSIIRKRDTSSQWEEFKI